MIKKIGLVFFLPLVLAVVGVLALGVLQANAAMTMVVNAITETGALTITTVGAINLTATTDVVVPANVGVTFGTGEKIEGDSTDLTVTSGGAINLTAVTDVVVPANVGVTFGTGEKIEGDDTSITITSGALINLTSTTGVVVTDDLSITNGALTYADTGTQDEACTVDGGVTLDLSTGNFFSVDMVDNTACVVTFASGKVGGIYVLEVINGGGTTGDFPTFASTTNQAVTPKAVCNAGGGTSDALADKATILLMARTASDVQILSCASNIGA